MTDQELEILLTEKCKALDLTKTAFDNLEQIFKDNSNDKDFFGGYEINEIKTTFERFGYQINRLTSNAIIKTRIGLYVEDKNQLWLDNKEPIGYYELDTDFNGEIVDDWFVIEKEKYLKDIGIAAQFETLNKKLPTEYLRRNHIQYEFVAYISLIGTLFISKQFEGAGRFIQRANTYLDNTDISLIETGYLLESKSFLTMMKSYLVTNNLVTDDLKNELDGNKNWC
jgi:hypothetical protein